MKQINLTIIALLLAFSSFAQAPAAITGTLNLCQGSYSTLADATTGGTWSSTNPAVGSVGSASGMVTGMTPGTTTIVYTTTGGSATAIVTVNPIPPAITGSTSLCDGFTTTLYDPATGGYWSISSPGIATIGFGSGILTGVSAGVWTCTYTLSTGCYTTITGTVNPVPSTISGTGVVCAGSTITETDATPGGTWSSSNVAIASIGSTGLTYGNAAGVATITYVVGGCFTSTLVTVNMCTCSGTPGAGYASAADTLGICPGSYASLNLYGSTASTAITYQWQYSPDGITWSDISGATSTSSVFFPPGTLQYHCGVTCTVSGMTAYSSPTTVPVTTGITGHSVVNAPDSLCNGPVFIVNLCGASSSFNITTDYGDGTSDNTPVPGALSANISHIYSTPGTYTIKHTLYNGATPMDSVSFSYEYLFCRTLPVRFYYDANHNCLFDAGDSYVLTPVTTEVDSNGVPVDTLTTTSGFYYPAKGGPGTIYTFHMLSVAAGLVVSCPSTGIISDTIQSTVNTYIAKYVGLNCSSSTAFDLSENVTMICGRHQSTGTIYVCNAYCAPESATVTMNISPKYVFAYSYPAPTTLSGYTATWNISAVSSSFSSNPFINFGVSVPGTWLTPGDTINSSFLVSPIAGDVNPANNSCIRTDTVRMSYDPNFIEVNPQGVILAGTQLQYGIHFENTGNDTAFNIYVIDTLSDNLDYHSLAAVMATSQMNIEIYNDGVHNIAKFDFPSINLLDSSHHGQCDGMFVFTIRAKTGLANGTTIFNNAGIFFDDNPVVLTNTVENIIGTPSLGTATLNTNSEIAIYPNPANEELTIKAESDLYSSYTIANSMGQAFINQHISSNTTTVNIQELPAGMYYITLKGSNGSIVRKFVKE